MSESAAQQLKPALVQVSDSVDVKPPLGVFATLCLFGAVAIVLTALHATLLRLPYFWDEAGYYIPAARDLLGGALIPHSTPSNAHPPLIMAWLALSWKIFGQSQLVTRIAMLLLAAFSLTGFYRLARSVANPIVAAASTFLTAIYPVFFAQSSLAQIDLPAAGLTFWALEAYFRRRRAAMAIWFALAALAKETAILVPLALVAWEVVGWASVAKAAWKSRTVGTAESRALPSSFSWWGLGSRPAGVIPLLIACIPLAIWYVHHYVRTGYVFGNPEFLRYNLQGNFHPLRILLALLLRIWQAIGYMNLYILAIACLLAMKYPAQPISLSGRGKGENEQLRPRIAIPVQMVFLAIVVIYLLALSVLGGAMLARYMLPVVPLFILVAVSTIWRRVRAWKAVLGVIAVAFVLGLFFNPPYGFAPEDNLAYTDYIRLHQNAEAFMEARYPHARVLTAWPASDELSRPSIGYVERPLQVVRIEDFTAEELMAATDEQSRFDVALVFSTKVQPARTFADHWRFWQEWKKRYFGYHVDLGPEAAASLLGGNLVYVERSVRRPGQWVGVIAMERIEQAGGRPPCALQSGRNACPPRN